MCGEPTARRVTSRIGIDTSSPRLRLPRQQVAGEIAVQLPGRMCTRTSRVRAHQVEEGAARNFASTKCGEVRGIHLTVDDPELPTLELRDEMDERQLRSVGHRARTSTRRRRRGRSPRRTGRRQARHATQVSIEWAWPASCRAPYASIISSVIHVPDCPGRGAAHASITSRNAVSARTVNPPWRIRFSSDRETCSSPGTSTMRGSGLHHNTGSPSLNQGKQPWEYASISRGTASPPPAARSPLGRRSARSTGGSGSFGPSHGMFMAHYAVFSTGLKPARNRSTRLTTSVR